MGLSVRSKGERARQPYLSLRIEFNYDMHLDARGVGTISVFPKQCVITIF